MENAILGEGERVRERERDERRDGVESECEVSVKASFAGIVIREKNVYTKGTLDTIVGEGIVKSQAKQRSQPATSRLTLPHHNRNDAARNNRGPDSVELS